MIKRKQRALVFFFIIYLTFTVMLVSLVVFTPGLEFEEEEGKVYLKNNSVHVVKNIKVELADGTPIDCVPQLMPGSLRKLYVPEKRRPTKIIAFAPFHPKIEKTLLPLGKKGFRLTYNINYDTPVRVTKEFVLKLELCAENADLNALLIKEWHDKSFFKEESQNRVIGLSQGKCRVQEFWFTPKRAGTTKISFSLEAENYMKIIEEEIRVW